MDEKSPASKLVAPVLAAAKHPLFEPLVLVLLSLATIGTAWCSYQAAAWGGAAQGSMNAATAKGRRAAVDQLQGNQRALLDVMLFSQFMNAHSTSNEALAQFYAGRFRSEARVAFDTWLAARPFENPDAPPHPFVTNLYQPRLLTEAREAEAESARMAQLAGEAGRTSRNYIMVTVMLATALFCGSTAAKFEKSLGRRVVLTLGLGAFVFAAVRLLQLPVQ